MKRMKESHRKLAIAQGQTRAWLMCKRKTKFSREDADAAGAQFGQRPYECPRCGYWHLTKHIGEPTPPTGG